VQAVLQQNQPPRPRLWLSHEDFVLRNQSTFKPFERYSDRLLATDQPNQAAPKTGEMPNSSRGGKNAAKPFHSIRVYLSLSVAIILMALPAAEMND
ncbi:MAG: hypothetical protein WBE37_20295, partial [Bryobacteraceae bacterium]